MNTHILQRRNNILFEWSVELISDPTYSGRQIRSWTVMWHKAMPLSVYVKTQPRANAYLNTRLLSYMVKVFYVHITTFYSAETCLIISNLTLLKFATARARGCARPATSYYYGPMASALGGVIRYLCTQPVPYGRCKCHICDNESVYLPTSWVWQARLLRIGAHDQKGTLSYEAVLF
jgi:hypothetical protein